MQGEGKEREEGGGRLFSGRQWGTMVHKSKAVSPRRENVALLHGNVGES